jgi:hypothetical protein
MLLGCEEEAVEVNLAEFLLKVNGLLDGVKVRR